MWRFCEVHVKVRAFRHTWRWRRWSDLLPGWHPLTVASFEFLGPTRNRNNLTAQPHYLHTDVWHAIISHNMKCVFHSDMKTLHHHCMNFIDWCDHWLFSKVSFVHISPRFSILPTLSCLIVPFKGNSKGLDCMTKLGGLSSLYFCTTLWKTEEQQ